MNSWYSKSLGDGVWADVPSAEIRRLFQPAFESAGRPAGMAVFTRHEEGRLHCQVVAYFSPDAGEVARVAGAEPCEKPERTGLQLLAGAETCWPALFVDGAN